jgi:hypothetical protein
MEGSDCAAQRFIRCKLDPVWWTFFLEASDRADRRSDDAAYAKWVYTGAPEGHDKGGEPNLLDFEKENWGRHLVQVSRQAPSFQPAWGPCVDACICDSPSMGSLRARLHL